MLRLCVQTFYGGAGGGAIELVAANDLVIGSAGAIHVDGGDAPNLNQGWDAGMQHYVRADEYTFTAVCIREVWLASSSHLVIICRALSII